MSNLSDTLKIENAPRDTPAQKRTVRLVSMGAFLRVYDWRPWLLLRSGSSLNANFDRVDGDSYIFVGFPDSSADKFAPESSGGCQCRNFCCRLLAPPAKMTLMPPIEVMADMKVLQPPLVATT